MSKRPKHCARRASWRPAPPRERRGVGAARRELRRPRKAARRPKKRVQAGLDVGRRHRGDLRHAVHDACVGSVPPAAGGARVTVAATSAGPQHERVLVGPFRVPEHDEVAAAVRHLQAKGRAKWRAGVHGPDPVVVGQVLCVGHVQARVHGRANASSGRSAAASALRVHETRECVLRAGAARASEGAATGGQAHDHRLRVPAALRPDL